MKKSLLLALVAATALTGACTMNDDFQTSPARGSAYSLSPGAMSAGIGQSEVTHASQTSHAGMVALEASRIALKKTSNPLVEQFAQFEIDEQTTLAGVLASIYPNMPKPQLSDEEEMMLKQLSDAPARQFDALYVQGQITGHEKLLEIQNTYLGRGRYLSQRNVARLAKGMIEQHLALLRAYKPRSR